MLAVSDTSAIGNLGVIGRLPVLNAEFREVLIPPAVVEELSAFSHRNARREIQTAVGAGWLSERRISDYRIVGLLTPRTASG